MRDSRFSVSIRKTALVFALILGLLQFGKVFWRTSQLIRSASEPGELTHTCSGCNRVLDLYSVEVASGHLNLAQLEPVLSDTDFDQDTLSAFQELLILTSDEDKDCDKDGQEDSLDDCPNCFGDGIRSRVLNVVIREAIGVSATGKGNDGKKKEIVYVLLTGQESIDLESSSHVFVATSRSDAELLRILNADAGGSFLEAESVVFIPGAFYVYRVLHECGSKCGWGKMVLLLDLPFVGPKAVSVWTIFIT